MLVDATTNHAVLTLMDIDSNYNQISIEDKDIRKTTFECLGVLWIYEWLVMPFKLKNAASANQRDMDVIFHVLIIESMKVYIDDVLLKSINFKEHFLDLEQDWSKYGYTT